MVLSRDVKKIGSRDSLIENALKNYRNCCSPNFITNFKKLGDCFLTEIAQKLTYQQYEQLLDTNTNLDEKMALLIKFKINPGLYFDRAKQKGLSEKVVFQTITEMYLIIKCKIFVKLTLENKAVDAEFINKIEIGTCPCLISKAKVLPYDPKELIKYSNSKQIIIDFHNCLVDAAQSIIDLNKMKKNLIQYFLN
jgi:hypothetical protein